MSLIEIQWCSRKLPKDAVHRRSLDDRSADECERVELRGQTRALFPKWVAEVLARPRGRDSVWYYNSIDFLQMFMEVNAF